ncbi:hypothetical protein ACH4E8_05675 [Streptomyces sp. NPDC017979]|uniref:hypothetical protein n=1 Tax=Streptomyces sp. NPDC017979 TaxID=3365024 RepID=UPI00379AC56E
MPVLARLRKVGLAVGMAAVLVTGLSGSAEAATGAIRYFNLAGDEFRIDNPPDNVCLTLQIRASLVSNETNKTVRVYLGTNCNTRVTDLAPGRALAYGGGPQSVRVLP